MGYLHAAVHKPTIRYYAVESCSLYVSLESNISIKDCSANAQYNCLLHLYDAGLINSGCDSWTN